MLQILIRKVTKVPLQNSSFYSPLLLWNNDIKIHGLRNAGEPTSLLFQSNNKVDWFMHMQNLTHRIFYSSNHYASSGSKLNFTFLRFPLSQRSISLQNDIGCREEHCVGPLLAVRMPQWTLLDGAWMLTIFSNPTYLNPNLLKNVSCVLKDISKRNQKQLR